MHGIHGETGQLRVYATIAPDVIHERVANNRDSNQRFYWLGSEQRSEQTVSVMADDENLMIINPDDSDICGIAAFRKHSDLWMDPRFQASKFEIRELQISISQSSTVAWFSCRMDDLALWDGKPCGWENVRWTGVLEKRDMQWVLVQMHFSFPRENR